MSGIVVVKVLQSIYYCLLEFLQPIFFAIQNYLTHDMMCDFAWWNYHILWIWKFSIILHCYENATIHFLYLKYGFLFYNMQH